MCVDQRAIPFGGCRDKLRVQELDQRKMRMQCQRAWVSADNADAASAICMVI